MTLTQGVLRELFEYRNGNLYWAVSKQRIKIGDLAGTVTQYGYLQIGIDGKHYLAHRLIFLYHHGYLPEFLDHIDGNKLNNDISNLREATNRENQYNRKKKNPNGGKIPSSHFKGVTWDKENEKWISQITIDGKHKYLGRFILEIEAAKAYDRAAIERDEKYARINGV